MANAWYAALGGSSPDLLRITDLAEARSLMDNDVGSGGAVEVIGSPSSTSGILPKQANSPVTEGAKQSANRSSDVAVIDVQPFVGAAITDSTSTFVRKNQGIEVGLIDSIEAARPHLRMPTPVGHRRACLRTPLPLPVSLNGKRCAARFVHAHIGDVSLAQALTLLATRSVVALATPAGPGPKIAGVEVGRRQFALAVGAFKAGLWHGQSLTDWDGK